MEQTKKLNMTAMSDKTNSNTIATLDELFEKKDEIALEVQHQVDRKSTRLNSSHSAKSRMPSSA